MDSAERANERSAVQTQLAATRRLLSGGASSFFSHTAHARTNSKAHNAGPSSFGPHQTFGSSDGTPSPTVKSDLSPGLDSKPPPLLCSCSADPEIYLAEPLMGRCNPAERTSGGSEPARKPDDNGSRSSFDVLPNATAAAARTSPSQVAVSVSPTRQPSGE